MAHNKQFEKAAIKSANREDYIHFKWAVIAKDWTVQRAMDAAGRAVITSKYRYAWIGGIAKTRGPKERWNKGDCIYKIMKINEEYTGGGSYGPPKFYWTDARGGAERRLKCETKKQLRAATPPAYR